MIEIVSLARRYTLRYTAFCKTKIGHHNVK